MSEQPSRKSASELRCVCVCVGGGGGGGVGDSVHCQNVSARWRNRDSRDSSLEAIGSPHT